MAEGCNLFRAQFRRAQVFFARANLIASKRASDIMAIKRDCHLSDHIRVPSLWWPFKSIL